MDKYTIFDFGLLHLEWTNALFVLVVFSICAFCMNIFLFKPVIRTLNNRNKWQGTSKEQVTQIQNNIDKATLEIGNIKKNSLHKISNYKEKQLTQAKKITNKILQETRQKLEQENQKFRKELRNEIEGLENNIEEFSEKLLKIIKEKI